MSSQQYIQRALAFGAIVLILFFHFFPDSSSSVQIAVAVFAAIPILILVYRTEANRQKQYCTFCPDCGAELSPWLKCEDSEESEKECHNSACQGGGHYTYSDLMRREPPSWLSRYLASRHSGVAADD